ncbi:hypothetical protein C8T65DRAFT_751497 [Cerioporus squamosus]|nr:hypothetical protein C8T65DRAFT_751497 [Cerioporus squamosus]
MSVPPPPPSPPSQRPPVYLLNDQSGKLAAEDAPPPAIARVLAHRRSAPNLRPPCPPPATPPPPVPPPARSPPTAHRSPPRRARPDACTERAAGSVCASPSLPPPRGMTYPPLAHPLFTPPLWTQYLMETESDDTQPWPPPVLHPLHDPHETLPVGQQRPLLPGMHQRGLHLLMDPDSVVASHRGAARS